MEGNVPRGESDLFPHLVLRSELSATVLSTSTNLFMTLTCCKNVTLAILQECRVSGLVNRNQSRNQVQEETNGLLQKPQSNQTVQSSIAGKQ